MIVRQIRAMLVTAASEHRGRLRLARAIEHCMYPAAPCQQENARAKLPHRIESKILPALCQSPG
jgi:hypothetical protein